MLELCLQKRFFDAGVGVSKGIAIFMWTFGFYSYLQFKQELSYRKQVACPLRRQCVECIYRPKYYTVTLKYRLRITQGPPLDKSYTTYY